LFSGTGRDGVRRKQNASGPGNWTIRPPAKARGRPLAKAEEVATSESWKLFVGRTAEQRCRCKSESGSVG